MLGKQSQYYQRHTKLVETNWKKKKKQHKEMEREMPLGFIDKPIYMQSCSLSFSKLFVAKKKVDQQCKQYLIVLVPGLIRD